MQQDHEPKDCNTLYFINLITIAVCFPMLMRIGKRTFPNNDLSLY